MAETASAAEAAVWQNPQQGSGPEAIRGTGPGRYRRDLSQFERSRRQREALLDSGLRVIAASGFAASSIGDVVLGAGVSRATFYIHFGSKEELLAALVARRQQELLQAMRRATESPGTPAIKAGRAVAAYLEELGRCAESASVLAREAASGGAALLKVRDAGRAELAGFFRALLGARHTTEIGLEALAIGLSETALSQVRLGQQSRPFALTQSEVQRLLRIALQN